MFELSDAGNEGAVIKVIGVGGGGGNALEHMIRERVQNVEFICANTDAQALKNSQASHVMQLGEELTKGLGAGADPQIGRQAAEENRDRIRELIAGADMVFITAGMGGGTGTGAAPIFAQIAKELGILTVAVVTKPFIFEGKKRMQLAEEGLQALAQHVDSLIVIPNNKLLAVLGKNITLLNAFKAANNVLLGAVQGIADLITRPGLINVDFAYGLVMWRSLCVGRKAYCLGLYFHSYLAYGLGVCFGTQAIVNFAVNMGWLPTKGLTLPLMSYGGSSLLVNCIVIALLLRISYEVTSGAYKQTPYKIPGASGDKITR